MKLVAEIARELHQPVSEILAMSEMDRWHMYCHAIRLHTRDRIEFVADMGAMLASAEDRREHLLNLADVAHSDDEDALQRLVESITRR